jgi:polyisoprenoid-binding protein YceI
MPEVHMAVPEIPSGRWTVDPVHSHVGFVARHMMIARVHGAFRDFSGEVIVGEDPLDTKVKAVVQTDSVDTGNADRDAFVKSNDFFDVAQHPEMSFESTGFAADGDDHTMSGDLTINGITKPVTFDVEFDGYTVDPWGNNRAGVYAQATVNRNDWGITWNAPLEGGGMMLNEKVKLELDLQIVQPRTE